MRRKIRLPPYASIIGEGTEVTGDIRFAGALHVEGKIAGNVQGISLDNCALTVGRSGIIEGDLDVGYVVIDGQVLGHVRAARRAELAAGARIEGTVYYGLLEMAEGAEVNGKLMRIEQNDTLRLIYQVPGEAQAADGEERTREEAGEEGAGGPKSEEIT